MADILIGASDIDPPEAGASMADQAKPVSRPWRRYLRLSVQGMIVLVLIIGVWLGWLVRSTRIQREAVAAIRTAGASVKYDWEWNNGKEIPVRKLWAPLWFTKLIGVDYFGHVTSVSLDLRATHALIEKVENLSRLQRLTLDYSSVTEEDLLRLKRLRELTDVSLAGTQVTDAGLAHLTGLTNLARLNLEGTRVSDAGLQHPGGPDQFQDPLDQ
jgi:hypothetical protein